MKGIRLLVSLLLVLGGPVYVSAQNSSGFLNKLFPTHNTQPVKKPAPKPAPVSQDAKINWSKYQLLHENTKLERQIDSLKHAISKYRTDLDITDTLTDDIMDFGHTGSYEFGKDISPEDYNDDVTDSLLSIWYLHRQIGKNDEESNYDMDSVHFSSNVPDKVYIDRLSKMNSYISVPYNQTVKNYIILYSEKMPTKMGHILGLAQYYLPIFEEVFNRYNMPEELKYVAIIESAFNPKAVSPAGAKGMWQFMYSTAKLYGLKIDSFVDERFDPYKAADAAARYLRDSYRIFGDWNLAISSYNCGAGNVNKAIKRCGNRNDFWSVYEYLPRETRGYVPAFVGAMYAVTYYKEHGIVPSPITMPAEVDTFHIHQMLHFQQVSDLTGVPLQMLRDLNPQYIHDIVPGNEGDFILRIPYNYTSAFIDCEDSLYTYKASTLFTSVELSKIKESTSGGTTSNVYYKVRRGDYLGRIASRYHVSVTQLKSWNHLRSNSVKVGQRLIVKRVTSASTPVAKGETQEKASPAKDTAAKTSQNRSDTASKASTASKTQTQTQASSVTSDKEYTIYTVKKGDTLFSISRMYPGRTVNEIMQYNNCSSNIHPGQKLKIPND